MKILLASKTLLAFLVATPAGLLELLGLLLLPRLWPDQASLAVACGAYQAIAIAHLGILGAIAAVLGGRHLRVTGTAAPTTAEIMATSAQK